MLHRDFPHGPVVKNLPSNAEDLGSIPGVGTKIPHAWGNGAHVPRLLARAFWSPCDTMR